MEALITINVMGAIYLAVTSYQIYTHRNIMVQGSVHHMISHNLMLLSAILSINLFVAYGAISPIVFTALYVIQHTYKENLRMLNNSAWVKDGNNEDYDDWIV